MPQGSKVVFLDTADKSVTCDGIHLLNRSSRTLLSTVLQLENEEALQLVGHRIEAVNFYDQKINSQVSFSSKLWQKSQEQWITGGLKWLGWVPPEREQTILAIRSQAVQRLLAAKIQNHKIASFLGKVKQADNSGVTLEDGTVIKPKTIVMTVPDKELMSHAQIDSSSIFYQQRVTYSYCSLADELHEAYVRSCPTGFISLVPLDNKQAFVTYCRSEKDEAVPKMDKSVYVKHLNEKLQQISDCDTQGWFSTTLSYPPLLVEERSERCDKAAFWSQVTKFCNKNVILLGDAAHTFYPYMMHETNIGLSEVSQLANLVASSYSSGSAKPVGDSYSTSARVQASTYGNLQHFLYWVTQTSSSTMKAMHALGTGLLNYMPLATYLLNEMAHGGFTSPFSLSFMSKAATSSPNPPQGK